MSSFNFNRFQFSQCIEEGIVSFKIWDNFTGKEMITMGLTNLPKKYYNPDFYSSSLWGKKEKKLFDKLMNIYQELRILENEKDNPKYKF
jgi:hypothetical protein